MTEIAKEAAQHFADKMNKLGFACDFSLFSLEAEIDSILHSDKLILRENTPESRQDSAGLEAYIGETLCRLYKGQWQGMYDPKNPAANFYLSFIEFGSFKWFPSHFIGYRVANGEESEGTFSAYLEKILPKITNGIATQD